MAALYARKNLAQPPTASVVDGNDSAETAAPLTADVVAEQRQWNATTRVFSAKNTAPTRFGLLPAGPRRRETEQNSILPVFSAATAWMLAPAVVYRKSAHCLIALEPTGEEALFLNSASGLDATGCSVDVASQGDRQRCEATAAAA